MLESLVRALAEIPQMEPVRLKMLLKAKDFYERFLDEMRDDPNVVFDAGEAGLRLGSIEEQLGDDKKAEAAVTEAIARFQKLLKGDPKDVPTARPSEKPSTSAPLDPQAGEPLQGLRIRLPRGPQGPPGPRRRVPERRGPPEGPERHPLPPRRPDRPPLWAALEAETLYGEVVDSQRKLVSGDRADPDGRASSPAT